MRLTFLILLFTGISQLLLAQLNCKTEYLANEKIITCYHKNHTISTKEIWRNNNFGNFKAFNAMGAQLINLELRKVGGHASAHVEYYQNGQVKKVKFSDAPDGGIQFYHSTTTFDEDGKQTSFQQQSNDDKPTITYQIPTFKEKITPVTVECGTIQKSVYSVYNNTSKTIMLQIKSNSKNNYLKPCNKKIKLTANQKIYIDSITISNLAFAFNEIYDIKILNKNTKGMHLLLTENALKNNLGNEFTAMITMSRKN